MVVTHCRLGKMLILTYLLTYSLTYLLSYLLTYLLTYSVEHSPLEADRFSSSQEFPAFYGTRRFIAIFTSACFLPLFWARSIQSLHPHPTSRRSILILSCHLTPGFSKWSLSLRFPHQNPVYISSLSPYVLRAPPISLFSILSPEQYLVKSTDH